MQIPKARYYIHMTINSPHGETDYTVEMNDLNNAMAVALKRDPLATSVVMSIVPNKDGHARLSLT